MKKFRTWLEIDNSAIRSNAKAILSNVPDDKIFLAMVKGNAWGIGSVGFAKALVEAGATWNGLELNASENIVSRAVTDAQGSVLTNKYAEGYPSKLTTWRN